MKTKKTILTIITSLLVLASCGNPLDPSNTSLESSENNTSDDLNSLSITSETSSDNTDSTSESSSSSETYVDPEPQVLTIGDIRPLALACASIADADGVGTSNDLVKFTGKLLARLDAITMQRNYGNRYKLLFVDATGYIYVKVDLTTYKKLENSIGNTYEVTGNPSIYVGAAEVVIKSYAAASAINVDLKTLCERSDSLANIHQYAASLQLNNKGVAFGKLVNFNAKYIGKADDAVLLFYDGNNIIYVHGNNYIGNNFMLNNSYELIASVTMFNFRPSVELLAHKSIANLNVDYDFANVPTVNGNSLYNLKYEVDKNATYTNYSAMFTQLYRFEGYANYYIKGNAYFAVMADNFSETFYSTYQTAAAAKTLFAKNENYQTLYTSSGFDNCPFDIYATDSEPVKIEVLFAPYLWNTQKYWQGYFLTDTINVIA